MKKTFFNLVVFTIFIALLGPISPLQAITLTSSPGKFSVQMPGQPQIIQTKHKTFAGTIMENTYRLIMGGTNYSVAYSDLPGIAMVFAGKKTIFKKAKKGLLKNAKGREESFKTISLGSYPGWELVFNIPSAQGLPGKRALARFYIVGKRLYVIVVSWTRQLSEVTAKGFLNSFKILP